MNKTITIMNVKMLLREFDKCTKKSIDYGFDGGHAYSFIVSNIYDLMIKLCEDNDLRDLEDEVTDHCNEWMYENEDKPECESRCDTCW